MLDWMCADQYKMSLLLFYIIIINNSVRNYCIYGNPLHKQTVNTGCKEMCRHSYFLGVGCLRAPIPQFWRVGGHRMMQLFHRCVESSVIDVCMASLWRVDRRQTSWCHRHRRSSSPRPSRLVSSRSSLKILLSVVQIIDRQEIKSRNWIRGSLSTRSGKWASSSHRNSRITRAPCLGGWARLGRTATRTMGAHSVSDNGSDSLMGREMAALSRWPSRHRW